MIDITITKDGVMTNHAIMSSQEDAEAWVAMCEADKAFGEIGTYLITYIDLDQDAAYISAHKNALVSKVNKEVDRIVGAMYSISEMILYVSAGDSLPDAILELKGTIQAAYADADPVIRIINDCTSGTELDALNGYRFNVLGEEICL
jgi:hypothetical protein